MNNHETIALARIGAALLKRKLTGAEEVRVLKTLDDAGLAIYQRREFKGRTPSTSEKMTPKLKARIRLYATRSPDKTHHEIAAHFNVNPGRVSEALSE